MRQIRSRKIAAVLLTAGLAVSSALPHASAQALQQHRDIPVRVELHSIKSLWISDTQFLQADPNGREVTLGVELRIAQGSGRRPTVLLMHGSGGIGANVPFWAQHFNSMGINTVVIDGMTGRDLVGVGHKQAVLGRLNFILDMYRALEIVARHPRVDTGKVAIMGFSRGGQAALYASLDRFHRDWNRSGINPIAYIPFYPDCATTYATDTKTTGKPIRIFHGTPDDYNPVATCKAYVARLKEAKADIELMEFPNAPHGYDSPIAPRPAVPAKDNQSVRDCKIAEGAGGQLVNQETKSPFAYSDACVKLHPHVGSDPEARETSVREVSAFLKKTFGLE